MNSKFASLAFMPAPGCLSLSYILEIEDSEKDILSEDIDHQDITSEAVIGQPR